MKAYSFKFQIHLYSDQSQIYVSYVDVSPKILSCLSDASMNTSTWLSTRNFKLKIFKSELYPTLPYLSPSTRPTLAILLLIHVWKPNKSYHCPISCSSAKPGSHPCIPLSLIVKNHCVVSVLPLKYHWLAPSFSTPTSSCWSRPLLHITQSSVSFYYWL